MRYRFAEFTVSPARRLLVRDGREVPLVPRYFDLLLFLLERRQQAVHRREIMDRVWSDVVVSDGALSQAVRSLRRAFGDDPREPRFVRTVSRHGYEFVFAGVVEEPDDATLEVAPASPETAARRAGDDPAEAALAILVGGADEEARREAAEALHALGTEQALRRLEGRPGAPRARALLRDSRWDVPGAGPVPLFGAPGGLASAAALVALRLRRASRAASARWTAASAGGAAAGLAGGLLGGALLRAAPGAHVAWQLLVVFMLIGALIGAVGAAGVGAGLAAAEAVAFSWRGPSLIVLGAAGGGFVGAASQTLGRWTLQGLFGHDLSTLGGGLEGLAIGGAAGLGYALSTPRAGGGMASPRGVPRLLAAALTGACCAVAAVSLTLAGGHMGGVSLDAIARAFSGSHAGLAPLGRLFGEDGLGPRTRALLAAYEGVLFGFGLALGLTRRPRSID